MSAETLTTISPTTNKGILTRTGATPADLEKIVDVSAERFKTWSKTPFSERQAIVKKALEILVSKKDEYAKELTEQMGRPIAYTGVEVTTAAKRGDYLLKISESALEDTPGEAEKGFTRYIKKVPIGPVLILFAWNPSPQTPTIVENLSSIFTLAGLPEGVIQFFHSGTPLTIDTIVKNPKVALIAFTGSVAGGLAVQKAAADRVVPVGLELGGKDAAYVRSDVDVAWAAEEIVDGAVFNSGQSCCSIERVYVDSSIHDKFVEEVQRVLGGYKLGDPFDPSTHVGPVISKRSKIAIEGHISDAVAAGARNVTPANASFTSPPADGNFVAPTLLVDVDHSMAVMTEETFGPVIPVMSVSSDAEAVKLMNDSEFGLTASIWTADTKKGAELAELVEAGTVFVNRCDFPSPDLAWTGWKNSGRGVTLSKYGFEQFVRLKSLHLKDYPK
ncbi:hypothetical protein GMDG_04299 [Pseudogymnoascus destructans 20631-21]|uniref:aldehyde dehydrogenase (NAD(+)) n=1 Tax=Pseudogymnoascus destructans (strain ATCC MYA-4855 / 20631-21) TaxID=658429 RepID=L8GCM7_PSED2|nr:hypothetical protein GMDG_04299 [Pseudogymnoascus destructans 20631-21]